MTDTVNTRTDGREEESEAAKLAAKLSADADFIARQGRHVVARRIRKAAANLLKDEATINKLRRQMVALTARK